MAKTFPREKPQDIHANNLQILKDNIKNGSIGGTYVFYGDEEYTKNHYSKLLTNEAGSNLNITCFYGLEFTLPDFISACETSAVESFDMFSVMDNEPHDDSDESYRVIKLYSPDLTSLSKKDSDYFLEFLKSLPEKTIVIFWFYDGEEDALSKSIYKKISEIALTVNFRREPIGSSVLLTWILRHFAKAKLKVDRHVALYLCQTVGNSMTDLKNEIEKLIYYLRYESRDTLEVKDIDFICTKSTTAQIFDVYKGALSGNFSKAAKALNTLRDKRVKPLLILGTISKSINDLCVTDNYIKSGLAIPAIAKMTGINEFTIKNSAAILSARNRDFHGGDGFCTECTKICLDYDRKLKSSRTDGYELLLELIFKLSFLGQSNTTS